MTTPSEMLLSMASNAVRRQGERHRESAGTESGPKDKVLRGPHLSGRTHQRTQLDSDSDAPLITGCRFGPLSSEDETFSVRVSPAQVALDSGVNGTPVRIAVPSSAPRGLKRLRLTRMSEATPVVALSGEIHVARPRQATLVDMTEVESEDDIGQEEAPVFDPVDSDDDVDSLVEELNVRVPSPRHSVVDALEIDLTREDSDQTLGEMQNSPLGELAMWIPEPHREQKVGVDQWREIRCQSRGSV